MLDKTTTKICYTKYCSTITTTPEEKSAKFPHSPILHYACRSLLTENNDKNNATAVKLCVVFVVILVAKQRTTYIEPHA